MSYGHAAAGGLVFWLGEGGEEGQVVETNPAKTNLIGDNKKREREVSCELQKQFLDKIEMRGFINSLPR